MSSGSLALNLVILVDESGSQTPADVMNEAQAASAIAQSLLNPASRVSVVGFGGADQQAPHADPTTVVCPPTTTGGTSNLETLARCVSGLHPRTAAQGYNTDYVGALGEALSILSARGAPGADSAILMMTDGGLDESYNPNYPQPNWQAAAHHAVDLELAQARQAGVVVWPLGFGAISAADQAYLGHLAQGGSQVACDDRPASRPRAVIAQDSTAAVQAFNQLYADLACGGTYHAPSVQIGPGQSRVLTVTIPPIASVAAISVYKASPSITADFFAPGHVPVPGGSLAGSQFTVSGADTPVEVLHVTNPLAGPWQIDLTAGPGLHSQLVSATVFWQGDVRASMFASPPVALPGQRIAVTLTVLGRNGPITDPAQLTGMQVQVSVAGDGLSGPLTVPVSRGSGPGAAAGDYTGTFTAPSTTGTLTLTGTVAAYGLHATDIPAFVTVSTAAQTVVATFQPAAPQTAQPGSTIAGQVVFANHTGQPQRVRLVLSTSTALATMASPTGELVVPSGRSLDSFVIKLAPRTPTGAAQLTVAAVSASQPSTRYGNGLLFVTIEPPQGIIGKYRWELLAAVVLLLLLVVTGGAQEAGRRRRLDVRDLVAALRHSDGSAAGPELPAENKRARAFRFVVRQPDGGQPHLERPSPGEPEYVARRDGKGGIVLKIPDGGDPKLVPDRSGTPVADGVNLVLRDRKGQALPDAGPPDYDPYQLS